ncbi:hypothetical protein G6F50_018620 [Rhizopus delemar]|uniref:Uncharacterized protein n=1 Tax=Rhizopus delemar TaxID=936053 RepID=A0A9P6XM12_9FUNG|nr:hypothetical protein G6F50_018620 [Rhizopus delemar]
MIAGYIASHLARGRASCARRPGAPSGLLRVMPEQNPAPSNSRPDPLADLNPAQRAAAEFGVNGAPGASGAGGPLLGFAGAGAGRDL